LQSNDATVLKGDKSKAIIIIINTDTLNKKVDTFIKDNIKQIKIRQENIKK